jgi:hypothetical protein
VDTTVVGIVDEVHVKRLLPAPVEVPVAAKTPAPVHRKASRKS